MAGIENTIIARLEKGGEKFEILVDPKLGYDFKTGVRKDLANVLMAEEVFKDANKGERQTATALKKAFGTENIQDIAKIIFKEGELQLTTDQRRKLLEEKKAKVIALIARNAIDPRAKTPIPSQRIENALEQARFGFDAFKNAEEQMMDAVEAIREIIPISIEKIKIAVKIPAEHSARAYGALKEYGLQKEEWTSQGDLVCVCEIPAGMQGEFYDRLNKLTAGTVQTKQMN
ncbi:MAG: ribosome assembly factor SBDS [Candidatus Norongarragalinales archaeon]